MPNAVGEDVFKIQSALCHYENSNACGNISSSSNSLYRDAVRSVAKESECPESLIPAHFPLNRK